MTQLLTARVVAQQLGLCTETVLAWVRDGKLPAIQLYPGGPVRIEQDELDAWLEERRTAPKTKRLSTATPDAVRLGRLSFTLSTATEGEDDDA